MQVADACPRSSVVSSESWPLSVPLSVVSSESGATRGNNRVSSESKQTSARACNKRYADQIDIGRN